MDSPAWPRKVREIQNHHIDSTPSCSRHRPSISMWRATDATVKYAINSPNDVFLIDSKYYCCSFYRGALHYGPYGGAGRVGYYNPATGGWSSNSNGDWNSSSNRTGTTSASRSDGVVGQPATQDREFAARSNNDSMRQLESSAQSRNRGNLNTERSARPIGDRASRSRASGRRR